MFRSLSWLSRLSIDFFARSSISSFDSLLSRVYNYIATKGLTLSASRYIDFGDVSLRNMERQVPPDRVEVKGAK